VWEVGCRLAIAIPPVSVCPLLHCLTRVLEGRRRTSSSIVVAPTVLMMCRKSCSMNIISRRDGMARVMVVGNSSAHVVVGVEARCAEYVIS
jgi:hypothetical protein